MNKVIWTGLIAISLTLLSGCQKGFMKQTFCPEQVARSSGAPEANEVVFVDPSLNRVFRNKLTDCETNIIKVTVDSQGIRPTETGTSQVWVRFLNHTDYAQNLEVRTEFFDSYGAPIDMAPTWQRIYVPAKSIETYTELSAGVNVDSYRVEVKGAK